MNSDFIHPSTHQNQDGTHDFSIHKGLTKREYFAAMAMQGMLAAFKSNDIGQSARAKYAVQQADALIKELNK